MKTNAGIYDGRCENLTNFGRLANLLPVVITIT
jgi:hypothetical protein